MKRAALSLVIVGALYPATFAAQSGPPATTFTRDIAPILQKSCQNCHRPGAIAPMSLLTYQDVRPWARAIKQKVQAREMPPWYIDRHIGIQKFKDDPSLTDAEIAMIAEWVDAGAPAGNPAAVVTVIDVAPALASTARAVEIEGVTTSLTGTTVQK